MDEMKTLQVGLQGMVSRGVHSVFVDDTGHLKFKMTDGAVLDLGYTGSIHVEGGSISHAWEGTTLYVTSDSGTSGADLKGADGKDGADAETFLVTVTGSDADGYTADKTFAEISAAVEAGAVVSARVAMGTGCGYGQLVSFAAGKLVQFGSYSRSGTLELSFTVTVSADDTVTVRYPAQRCAVRVASVKSESSVTVTSAYDDGTESVSVVTLDANGDPVSVTTDGVTCTLTWEGFDE